MKTSSRTSIAIVMAAAATVLALTGCSAPATTPASTTGTSTAPSVAPTATADAETGQSKEDACTIAIGALQTVSTDLNSSMGTLQKDPKAAAKAIKDQAAKFTKSMDSVTNADVSVAAKKADAAFADLSDGIDAVVKEPSKASAMMTSVTTLQTAFTDLGKACA